MSVSINVYRTYPESMELETGSKVRDCEGDVWTVRPDGYLTLDSRVDSLTKFASEVQEEFGPLTLEYEAPKDDPASDPVGTIRSNGQRTYVKARKARAANTGATVWCGVSDGAGYEIDTYAAQYPVVGVVPGSEADVNKEETR
jgi:hypothetical protein